MAIEARYFTHFEEWLRWYNWHRGCSMTLENEVKFLRRAVQGLWQMLSETADQLEVVDKQKGSDRPKLVLPSGIRFYDNLHVED